MLPLQTKLDLPLNPELITGLANLSAPQTPAEQDAQKAMRAQLPMEMSVSDFVLLGSFVGEHVLEQPRTSGAHAETAVLATQIKVTNWLGKRALQDGDRTTYHNAHRHLDYLKPSSPIRSRLARLALFWENRVSG